MIDQREFLVLTPAPMRCLGGLLKTEAAPAVVQTALGARRRPAAAAAFFFSAILMPVPLALASDHLCLLAHTRGGRFEDKWGETRGRGWGRQSQQNS